MSENVSGKTAGEAVGTVARGGAAASVVIALVGSGGDGVALLGDLVLSAGCGFVARTHAGNLPHLREMFREALRYPGFAFVHVLAACATCQPLQYAEELFQRCDLLPPDHDAADFGSACAVALDRRFKLGMIYRRRAGETLAMMAHTEEEPHSED